MVRPAIGQGCILMLGILVGIGARAAPELATPDSGQPSGSAIAGPTIPDALEAWVPWVLEGGPDGQDRRACPLDPRGGERICAWAGRLDLDLTDTGGTFSQDWRLYVESRVPLPGDGTVWPLDVLVDDRPVPVVARDGTPTIELGSGRWTVTGRFDWARPPDALALPPLVGLVALVRDGIKVAAPRRDLANRLWLGEPTASEGPTSTDRLSLEVYRRIQDSLPLEVQTRLQLEVSGGARELQLGPVLLPGGIPLRLEGPLPARLEENGMLRVQVRPGRWTLDVGAHHPGDVSELRRASADPPWPLREIWAFDARPDLRRVALTGPEVVDPRQTGIPEEWRRLPVFRVGPEAVLRMTEQVRGDPDPGPDRLRLERRLWLDFDGFGYSVQDRIGGRVARGWRLDAGPGLEPGQVTLDGQPVLITRLDATSSPGVELRRGDLDLVADARIESAPDQVPASGWARELEAVDAELHLPPGWDLLTVQGTDNLPDTWIGRWSLLDLFLVLVTALGIGRLRGWGWGLLALATLVLTWQSPGAPRLVWLHILGAAALLRLMPEAPVRTGLRRIRLLIAVYFRLALLALLVIGLPFLATEARDGLFPHLERPWIAVGNPGVDVPAGVEPSAASQSRAQADGYADRALERIDDALSGSVAPSPAALPDPITAMDPDARLQTGPGIPEWRWNRFHLAWTGPVGERDSARLWLITPAWNRLLSLLGALLVLILGLRMAGLIGGVDGSSGAASAHHKATAQTSSTPPLALLVLLVAVGASAAVVGPGVAAADLPSPELLKDLRARLLAPPACLPDCVDLAELQLRADPRQLVLELTLDAATNLATPIPGGGAGGWLPTEVRIDGDPAVGLRRDDDGRLLLPLSPGRHRVRLGGGLAGIDQVEIPLPLAPRRVRSRVEGWQLEGLDGNGRAAGQIRLVRLAEDGAGVPERLAQGALPPLLRIERTLAMGIDWRVETRVRRLSPPEFPILIQIPLLPGESVQTADLQVEDRHVMADLPAGVPELRWSSRLEPVDALRLTASSDPRLSEDWRLDVGPQWHLEASGLAPVHRLGAADRWLPAWRPLPGESLDLRLARPPGVPGPSLTIDRVQLQVEPGHRGTRSTLILAIRSSQGGEHRIRLPDTAEPISVSLNGRSLPLAGSAPELSLPLTPGDTRVEVAWREPKTLALDYRPDPPDLGAPAVNLALSVRLPEDRWVLWTRGFGIGPVVLFWALLPVLIVLAVALGRSRLTPLRFRDWLLLGLGLMLARVWVALLVVGWLFALGLRHRTDPAASPPWRFNLVQIALAALTVGALIALLGAVQQGLLGPPAMQIMGNGSTATSLDWYLDRGGPRMPDAQVVSVPIWVYRALMLAWALWLAMRLLDWLRWGWEGFAKPWMWLETRRSAGTPRAPMPDAEQAEMRLDL